ncbi:MAG: hypothetical protein KF699_01125 [Phycisphaeraceae bacterium]|nr:hypothetical protein [Phycisphaeraceae bacterium]
MIARSTSHPDTARPAWLEAILWAAYLACSWTWCIGMFLPVLLVRDFGVWGWVVFAVPNVIGAAAMGWVLRDGASERIVSRHRTAVEWFRLVTVVFQLWFLASFVAAPITLNNNHIVPDAARFAIVAAMVAGLLFGLDVRLGLLAWLGSAVCAAMAASRGGLEWPGWPGAAPTDVLWLAPVCAFGFALCPYLDPTFHQARQATRGGTARAVFTLGFGVLFLAMIVFTLGYAQWGNEFASGAGGLAQAAALFIALHIAMQLVYTCTVHARATPGRGPWPAARIAFAMLAACGVALATPHVPVVAGLAGREVVYRLFMSFYGLVFPAYVWLLMIPRGTADSSDRGVPGRRAMRVFWLAVGIAAPFYWMGFIERAELWLVPGLGIVLASRLFVAPRT